jgi:nicotinamide riboside transporter PnuC
VANQSVVQNENANDGIARVPRADSAFTSSLHHLITPMSFLDQLRAWSPAESLAAALGLAYLLLAVRRNLWCWLCAFASTVIYFVIFLRA